MADLDYGQAFATTVKVMKEVYEPLVQKQVSEAHPLFDALQSTRKGVDGVGKWAVIGLIVKGITSAGPYGEREVIEDPDAVGYENVKINLTNQRANGAISGLAEVSNDGEKQSLINALENEMNAVRDAAKRTLATQVHGRKAGDLATVSAVTDADPVFTLTFANDGESLFRGRWVTRGQKVQFGSVTSGVATVDASVFKTTSIDLANLKLTVTRISGSYDPAVADKVFINGSANKSLDGLTAILDQTSLAYEQLSSADEEEWKSYAGNAGGAITLDKLDLHSSEVAWACDDEIPDLLLCRKAIQRTLVNELQGQVKFAPQDKLGKFGAVALPGGQTLTVDPATPKGTIRMVNTKYLKQYTTGDWQFLTQGGQPLMRLARADVLDFVLKRHIQIGCSRRNAHGYISGITGDTSAV